jgi:hypothetical protein
LGLSLLINPNKSKWWRYRFQFEGKAKMMSLGTYPEVSLAQARAKLAEYRTLVASGINPITQNQMGKDEKEKQASTMSLNEVRIAFKSATKRVYIRPPFRRYFL